MVVDLLEHFELGPRAQVPVTKLGELLARHPIGGLALRMHQMRIGRALVIDHQNGPAGIDFGVAALGIDEIDVQRIMVVTDAARPVVGFGSGVGIGRQLGVEAVASGMQHGVAVARGQHHVVEQALVQRGKAQCAGHLPPRCAHQRRAARQHRQAGQAQTAAQHHAPARTGQGLRKHALKMRIVRGVAVDFVIRMGHGGLLNKDLPSGAHRCDKFVSAANPRWD